MVFVACFSLNCIMVMRVFISLCIVLFLSLSITFAQTLKAVEVVAEQTIVLATLGKDTRNDIPIVLPANTVEWYYAFTTSTNARGTGVLNLLVQIGALLARTRNKTAGDMLSRIEIPKGSSRVDIYLLDYNNKKAFRKKTDLWGGRFYSYERSSITSYNSGKIKVASPKSGTLYLGLKHGGGHDSVYLTIEVIAIVKSSY